MEDNILNIETTTIISTEELLVYYLYKYNLDLKSKNKTLVKEDIYFISKYALELGIDIKKEEL